MNLVALIVVYISIICVFVVCVYVCVRDRFVRLLGLYILSLCFFLYISVVVSVANVDAAAVAVVVAVIGDVDVFSWVPDYLISISSTIIISIHLAIAIELAHQCIVIIIII